MAQDKDDTLELPSYMKRILLQHNIDPASRKATSVVFQHIVTSFIMDPGIDESIRVDVMIRFMKYERGESIIKVLDLLAESITKFPHVPIEFKMQTLAETAAATQSSALDQIINIFEATSKDKS